ncbi:hypothetical protein B6U91_01980 [Candidatus Pacearchaeota archaeon ex4484_71]|nr:MAG: hypothetical protein B6U91_01980 [Candidatus Pacearchaeota archaeon ex4484_71]
MVEPQIVINKSWAEHKLEEELKAERNRKVLLITIVIILSVAVFFVGIDAIARFLSVSYENAAIISVVFIIVLILLIAFRKRIFKRKKKEHAKRNEWKKCSPPNWIIKERRKLGKRRVINKTFRGRHYIYLIKKRSGHKTSYYRKRR